MLSEIDSVSRTANANGVTLYPLYASGLGYGTPPRANVRMSQTPQGVGDFVALNNELEGINPMAERTGGIAQWGTENIVKTLPRIRDDFDSYYSLAYRATASGTDRAHKIVVKAKNRNYVVRSRKEYVEKSEATRISDRVVANLLSPLGRGTIAIEATLGAVQRKERNRHSLPVRVHIPIAALMTVPEGAAHAGGFTVYIGFAGKLGEIGQVTRQTRSFSIPSGDLEKTRTGKFTYDFDLLIDNRTDRLSIAVVDEVSKEVGMLRLALPPRGGAPAPP